MKVVIDLNSELSELSELGKSKELVALIMSMEKSTRYEVIMRAHDRWMESEKRKGRQETFAVLKVSHAALALAHYWL